jgi:hypothetical protein
VFYKEQVDEGNKKEQSNSRDVTFNINLFYFRIKLFYLILILRVLQSMSESCSRIPGFKSLPGDWLS